MKRRQRHKLFRLLVAAMALSVTPLRLAARAEEVFEGSLVFSPAEQRAIEVALGLRPASDMETGLDDAAIDFPDSLAVWSIERVQLSALIYVNAAEWTLWLGGARVTPGNLPPYLADLRVMPGYVDVSVIRHPGAVPVAVRLRPNQTFLLSSARIIEGSGFAR